MRLKRGRLGYYTPRLDSDEGTGFARWEDLLDVLQSGACTPVLGSGLTDSLLGPSRELARRLSDAHEFHLAPHIREDLSQVAQYVATTKDYQDLRRELQQYLRGAILDRYRGPHREEGQIERLEAMPLDELMATVGAWRRQQEPVEPHAILAGLSCPIYITTNPDDLLGEALRSVGKQPQVLLCPWNDALAGSHALLREPTPQQPLVYHFFGRLDKPDSLVLTEDDYFDYLIGVSSRWEKQDLLPAEVQGALVNTSLLFLGFHVDDWSFRVFYRSIANRGGAALRRRKRFVHVAVQIDPEEGRFANTQAARGFLQSYFEDEEISIYWGRVDDFVRDLRTRWNERCVSDPNWRNVTRIA
jgi:hypothetical protein